MFIPAFVSINVNKMRNVNLQDETVQTDLTIIIRLKLDNIYWYNEVLADIKINGIILVIN